jgi:hypothetical protein
MKKIIAKKILILGIILLFLTAGFIPNISSVKNVYEQNFEILNTDSFYPFEEGWFYQKQITINHEMVNGEFAYFPVLIHIIDSDLSVKAQNDGDDIIFMDNLGYANKLSHEIEFFDDSSGELICWINVSSVSISEDTIFYMYYGNPICENQEEITDTWDSNYVLVQHLDEISGVHYDSSVYGNDGTCLNGTDQNAEGFIDGADGFDGTNDWINCGNNECFNLTEEMTLEAWVNRSGDGTGKYLGIVGRAKDTSGPGYNRYQLRYKHEDDVVHFFLGNDTNYTIVCSDNDLALGVWTHLVVTWDGTNMYMFVDGIQQSEVGLFTSFPDTTSADLEIGRYFTINYFAGLIDEVRVSNIYRDPNWITTEYNNQNNPSSFYTVGTENSYLQDWQYRKKITINPDLVEEDLENFPILIKTVDSDLASKAQDDGDDILFTDGSVYANKLSHEIEFFDGSSGELICWVKVESVSSVEDTIIYMYYGNPGCISQENPNSVWDNGFVMVQHLDETSGTHYDSTVYGNDGTCVNGTDQNAEGFIDGADGFDGTDDWIYCGNDDSLDITDEMTLEAWVNRSGDGLGRFLGIITRRGSGYNRYQIRYAPDDDVAQFFLGDSSSYTILNSDNDLSLDEWAHLAATWDGTNMKMFVNGIEQTNISSFTSSPNTHSADLEIGRYTEQNYFQGLIDEVRISNINRGSSWIITEFNNQNDPNNFVDIGPEEDGENLPPSAPEIDGPTQGRVGETYLYSFMSIDPEGSNVYYRVVWGDGEENDWFGPYESGKVVSVTKTWMSMGRFTMYAYAKDTEELESDYSTLVVNIPRYRIAKINFFQWFIEQFPLLNRMLLNILK